MSLNPIEYIVPTEQLQALWMAIDPFIYEKDGKPYGLLAPQVEPTTQQLVVYSATKDDQPFTLSMIKDIRKLCRDNMLTHILTGNLTAAKRIKEKFEGKLFKIDLVTLDDDSLIILVYRRD